MDCEWGRRGGVDCEWGRRGGCGLLSGEGGEGVDCVWARRGGCGLSGVVMEGREGGS